MWTLCFTTCREGHWLLPTPHSAPPPPCPDPPNPLSPPLCVCSLLPHCVIKSLLCPCHHTVWKATSSRINSLTSANLPDSASHNPIPLSSPWSAHTAFVFRLWPLLMAPALYSVWHFSPNRRALMSQWAPLKHSPSKFCGKTHSCPLCLPLSAEDYSGTLTKLFPSETKEGTQE